VREQAGRRDLKLFMDSVRLRLRQRAELSDSRDWMDAINLAKRIYRLTRTFHGPELVKCAAMAGVEWSQRTLPAEKVLVVIRTSLFVQGVVLRPAEEELLQSTLLSRDAILAEADIGHIEQVGPRYGDPIDEDREICLTARQLRELFRRHFAGRLKGVPPEDLADDLVEYILRKTG
jgi:hypothetical protein